MGFARVLPLFLLSLGEIYFPEEKSSIVCFVIVQFDHGKVRVQLSVLLHPAPLIEYAFPARENSAFSV